MRGPDPKLMREFGTEAVYREKLAGGIPLGLRFALGYNSLANAQSERARQDELQAQAKAMNAQLAYVRSRMMAPVDEGFRHTRVPLILGAGHYPGMLSGADVPLGMDEGMVRMAQAAGVAIDELEQWEKDAGIGTLLSGAASGVARAVGSAAGAVAKLPGAAVNAAKALPGVGTTMRNTFSAVRSGTAGLPGMGATRSAIGAGKATFSRNLAAVSRGAPVAKVPVLPKAAPMPSVKSVTPTVAPPPTGTLEPAGGVPARGGVRRLSGRASSEAAAAAPAQAPGVKPQTGGAPKVEPPSTPAEPTGGQAQGPQPPPAVPARQAGSVAPPPAAGTAPAPAATPKTAPSGTVTPPAAAPAPAEAAVDPKSWEGRAKAFWAKSGLSSGLGWKIPLVAGVGLGAYGLSRAAKGTADLLNSEKGDTPYNKGGARAMPGINEWGQPGR